MVNDGSLDWKLLLEKDNYALLQYICNTLNAAKSLKSYFEKAEVCKIDIRTLLIEKFEIFCCMYDRNALEIVWKNFGKLKINLQEISRDNLIKGLANIIEKSFVLDDLFLILRKAEEEEGIYFNDNYVSDDMNYILENINNAITEYLRNFYEKGYQIILLPSWEFLSTLNVDSRTVFTSVSEQFEKALENNYLEKICYTLHHFGHLQEAQKIWEPHRAKFEPWINAIIIYNKHLDFDTSLIFEGFLNKGISVSTAVLKIDDIYNSLKKYIKTHEYYPGFSKVQSISRLINNLAIAIVSERTVSERTELYNESVQVEDPNPKRICRNSSAQSSESYKFSDLPLEIQSLIMSHCYESHCYEDSWREVVDVKDITDVYRKVSDIIEKRTQNKEKTK